MVRTTRARAVDFAARNGIAAAEADLALMLGDPAIGAVYISSTNEKHHGQTLAAIAAGKHVLCEKPPPMTVAEAVETVRAAAEADCTFATNHHMRCSGSHRTVRDLIAKCQIDRGPVAAHFPCRPSAGSLARLADQRCGRGRRGDPRHHRA